jgi:acyl dehydratase
LAAAAFVQRLKAADAHPTQASIINAMLRINDFTGEGLYASHDLSFALAGRGQAAGVDNCDDVTEYSGRTFRLVSGMGPICGHTIPDIRCHSSCPTWRNLPDAVYANPLREKPKMTTSDVDGLPTTDVDKYVGQFVGGGQLKEPVSRTDIRRWVQAMNYPNPRHFDEEAAAQSRVGQIVAPQSFAVCCDVSEGAAAALVGKVPNTHTVFGGDEWWFYGSAIYPDDTVRVRRRFQGYSVAETKFAGPTMFSRGDTLYVNQRKDPVAKQRCTMARYRPDLARERGYFDQMAEAPVFSAEQLRQIERQRLEWVASGRSGEGPADVRVGDKLPTRAIGPHTTAGFATEWSAFTFSVWGSYYMEGQVVGLDAGWLPEMLDSEQDGSDPAMQVSMTAGPSSAHLSLDKANLVGLPRHYGLGASMGAWMLDYLAYWAGDEGFICHSRVDYRSPVFEGDVAFVNGEITDQRFEPLVGTHLLSVHVEMTNQDGVLLARGDAQVQLSRL